MPRGPKGEKRPAAAGLTDKHFSMTDLAQMVDAVLPKPGKRGPYKQRLAA